MFFIFPRKFVEEDPPTLCSKQPEARGLHSVSVLFFGKCTSLEDFKKRYMVTLKKALERSFSARQDLEKQEMTSYSARGLVGT
jgi:hypothetical protein